MTQCYMCSNAAVSREHVPPLCIFPEIKDLPVGLDYRKNLIKVPACDEHNLRKSGDDEYLLFVFASNFDSNSVALQQWLTKVRRSIKYRPSKVRIFKRLQAIVHRGVQTGMYFIDRPRLLRELERISRGIYYSHFGKQWLESIVIAMPFAVASDEKVVPHLLAERKAADWARRVLSDVQPIGSNPEVFYYQIKTVQDRLDFVLKMVFYSGLEIIALCPAQTETSEPEVI